ncbi:TIGR01457 family HAD-type hydrolase [Anaerobacillus alkaliphilus]|uniref:TIGR01457 family HAD-type hydrolase n=1 Tax=Anaerobacillus alkaliphilus TaxID=1548597 RepID=A0A4Q0VUF2_9BACI|nr:TIGR01457 family HAD-type hydrolase [Anaerobacillus alkaliphilus]RXJ01821.1 TIGR01457 family HAD-type hydrolase [Anaerobacillus alkaliphilus]
MKHYEGYLIDLDGTMYRGKERIDEAVDFVKELVKRNIPYLFVTNNSSKTCAQVADHLSEMGIPATDDQVFTTSLATAQYIAEEKQDAKIYMIGEEGLRDALEKQGFTIQDDDVDYVIMGIDRDITYEKLAKACLAVRAGAKFISTNGDIALPTERGFMPGNGSLTSVVAVSTETAPIFIGKPESIIVNQALEVIGTPREKTVMVGDNYQTDIMAGINAKMDTIMVHTGVTSKEQLTTYTKQPTFSIHSLSEWKFV